MAINKNKVQLQETVLDSNGHPLSSTDVNPLTSSDCVIMENGMTLEDVMGNDTVIDTPTIMNEDTSFQAGIGDSETKVIDSDVAKMVIEGKTYQNILPRPTTLIMNTDEKEFKINDKIDSSIVLDDNVAEIATVKGQTYVNVVQEESASEYVAIDEELNGQSITTTGKPEGMVKNATLEGLTLVNTIQEPSGADATVLDLDADIDAQSATIDNTVQGGIKSAILSGNTLINSLGISNVFVPANTESSVNLGLQTALPPKKYILFYNVVTENTSPNEHNNRHTPRINLKDGSSLYQGYDGFNTTTGRKYWIFTANSDIVDVYYWVKNISTDVTVNNCMLIEYQQGMENWDIPYFTGMQSVKLPVLTTTGKNLFDISKHSSLKQNTDCVITATWFGSVNPTIYNLKPNTKYTLSFLKYGTESSWVAVEIDGVFSNNNNSDYSKTFTTNSTGIVKIRIGGNTQEDIGHKITNIQLEESPTPTTYEPYKTNILTVNEDIELRGIGNVQDTLDCSTGEVTERIGEIVLDGSEEWKIEYNTFRTTVISNKVFNQTNSTDRAKHHLTSDKYASRTYIDSWESGKFIALHVSKEIVIKDGDFTTTRDWVQHLQQNPVTVQYRLAKESIKTVDLSIVDQDNNPLKTIQAQPTLTHITTSSNGLIPFVTIPSQLKYPTIIKPSTTYTVQLKQTTVNSEFPLTINLGGTVMAVPSTKFTIATPETLTSQDVIFTGKNNVIGEVVITEGDTTGIEYDFFEGMNDVKSPSMHATGKNLFDINHFSKLENWDRKITTERPYDAYEIKLKPNTSYTFSRKENSKGDNVYFCISQEKGVYGWSGGIVHPTETTVNCRRITITTDSTGILYLNLYQAYKELANLIPLLEDAQLEEGTQATSYEPYKGVTIEQSIDSIPLTSDMFEQGGLVSDPLIVGMSLQQVVKGESTNTTRIRSKSLIPVKPNCKYILNGGLTGWGLSYDKNGGYVATINNIETFTTTSNTYYITPVLRNSDNSNITPSTLNSVNLVLQEVTDEIVLRSIGDVKDTLNLTTGEYVQRIKEVELGDLKWAININWSSGDYLSCYCTTEIADRAVGMGGMISDKLSVVPRSQAINSANNVCIKECIHGDVSTSSTTYIAIAKTKLVNYQLNGGGMESYLKDNSIKLQYVLATPIIHKVNLTNTTKLPSYASTTHYDTIVPSNSLVPNIKIPSTVDYNVAIKPSTQYTIRANTTNALSVDLGGSTGTLANGKVTLTTPSTLAHNSLKLGNGKAKEVMVVEGGEIKDNVPFFNGMKNVQMGGIKLVNVMRNILTHNEFITISADKRTITYTDTGYFGNVNFDGSLLKPNTLYTLYFKITQNTSTINMPCGINIDGNVISPIVGNGGTGTFKVSFTSLDKLTREPRFVFRHSTNDSVVKIQDLMLFEGDWTYLDEIPFIESEMIIEQPIIRSQGKNLFDMNKAINGKWVNNTNGSIVDSPDNFIYMMDVKPNTRYTASFNGTIVDATFFAEYSGTPSPSTFIRLVQTGSITTSSTTKKVIVLYSCLPEYIDKNKDKFQIEEGSTNTPYEPFKQHTLSSNRVIGYEENCYYAFGGGAKVSNDGVNSMLADVEGLSIAYATGGSSSYTFWDKDNVFISGKQYLDTSLSSYDKNGFIQVPSNAKYMRFASGNETTSNTYKTAAVTGELPLRSLPNGVCDTLNLVTGEYVQRVGEVVLDGSETDWLLSASTVNLSGQKTISFQRPFSGIKYTGIKGSIILKSDKLSCLPLAETLQDLQVDMECIKSYSSTSTNVGIRILKSKLITQDIDGFKQYLSQNPITVQYELETPIVRKIGLTAKGNYKEITLNGSESESWQQNGFLGNFIQYDGYSNFVCQSLQIPLKNTGLLCNSFKYYSYDGGFRDKPLEGISDGGGYKRLFIRIKTNKLVTNDVSGLKQYLSQNPMKVGYLTTNSASLYSNIQKPIFFNNVKVQFMNDNVDIQPTLTLQTRSRNSYVMDMMKANTRYTLKALANPNSFTIDGTSYNATTNGTFTSPSTLTNKLLITGQDVQELMIVEGDVTGKQLPYYKGIRSSFDNTDKVEVFVRNKNLFDINAPFTKDGAWSTVIEGNSIISTRINDNVNGAFGAGFRINHIKPNTVYTLSWSSGQGYIYVYNNSGLWGGNLSAKNTNEGNSMTFTTKPDTKYITIGFNYGQYDIGTVLTTSNVQLEEGSVVTPYQPHEENSTIINMPTQLETVEVVRPNMEIGGIRQSDGVEYDSANDRRTKGYIPVEPGMILAFMNGNAYRAENIRLYDINKNYIRDGYTNGSRDLIIPKDCYFIRFYSSSANTSDISVVKQQYKPIALNELPNGVKDELIINRATSSAKLIRRVGKVVLDGSENWSSHSWYGYVLRDVYGLVGFKHIITNNDEVATNIITDSIPITNINSLHIAHPNKTGLSPSTSSYEEILLNISTIPRNNLALLKNYLKDNPLTVYYELAEPVITEIRLKGYPFVYEDGSISLNTDIAPVTRTSYNVNQHQLINSQNETIIRHDKQISDLYDYIEIYLDEIYHMELFKMQLELSL